MLDGAVHQQIAIGDVSDLVAALGLVHVRWSTQHGEAVGGERVDLVPEFTPRLGIDAGGRLVEQQQLRARQRAGAERQPLRLQLLEIRRRSAPRGRRARACSIAARAAAAPVGR